MTYPPAPPIKFKKLILLQSCQRLDHHNRKEASPAFLDISLLKSTLGAWIWRTAARVEPSLHPKAIQEKVQASLRKTGVFFMQWQILGSEISATPCAAPKFGAPPPQLSDVFISLLSAATSSLSLRQAKEWIFFLKKIYFSLVKSAPSLAPHLCWNLYQPNLYMQQEHEEQLFLDCTTWDCRWGNHIMEDSTMQESASHSVGAKESRVALSQTY